MRRMNLRKNSLNLWIILFLEKNMENLRNYRDIKLVTSEKRRKRLVLEPNYDSCKKNFWSFNGNINERNKTKKE